MKRKVTFRRPFDFPWMRGGGWYFDFFSVGVFNYAGGGRTIKIVVLGCELQIEDRPEDFGQPGVMAQISKSR